MNKIFWNFHLCFFKEGVDNDDGSSYYYTHDNFLVYGMWGMKNNFGGHDSHHFKNIYTYIAGTFVNIHSKQLVGHEDYFYGKHHRSPFCSLFFLMDIYSFFFSWISIPFFLSVFECIRRYSVNYPFFVLFLIKKKV